jgi:ribosomal protein S18 acetylase RimI-like enzyme
MPDYRPIHESDLAGIVALCAAEPWPSYIADPRRTWQALTAPGVTTIVAVESGRVLGFAQVLSDGAVAAFLSLLLVAPDRRREGIGTQLIRAAFSRCGADRLDLLTDDVADARGFYRKFVQHELLGFRVYPRHTPP